MRYSIVVHKEQDSCYGVTVPDIEGCFSAGDTLDEALDNTKEAIQGHLELLAEDGIFAPTASLIDTHLANPDYNGGTWAYLDIDITAFLGKTEKANVTLPKLLIKQIDAVVQAGNVKSRSAFLAESAMQVLNK